MKHDVESHEDTVAPADQEDWSPDEPSAEAYSADPDPAEPAVDRVDDPQATQVVEPDDAYQHGDSAAAAPAVARAPVEPVPGDGHGQDRDTDDRDTDDRAPLWSHGDAGDIDDRWRDVLLRFVEDPRTAADEAQSLTSEALDRFSASVKARKQELDGWQQADHADTEQLRMAVREYRLLLDRLLAV